MEGGCRHGIKVFGAGPSTGPEAEFWNQLASWGTLR